MAQRWSEVSLLVPPTALPLPAPVADADDILGADEGPGPIGPSGLGLGTVCAGTTRTKPLAVAVEVTDDPRPASDMTIEATRPTDPDDKPVARERTVPLRSRLAGDEPSGLDTAGWQILWTRVDCADPDRIASSLASSTSRGPDGGRPDRPLHADRPARDFHGFTGRGTKGGRSER
jgi:hypothetical protein